MKTAMTRRGFLTLAWAATTALAAAAMGGIGLWHASPTTEEEAREIVELDAPPQPGAPIEIARGHFAWASVGQGAAAISEVCPHMGCALTWQAGEGQFQCPCHGSTFDAQGRVLHGPADHGLDYLAVTALDADGRVVDETSPQRPWVRTGSTLRYRIHIGKILTHAGSDDAA